MIFRRKEVSEFQYLSIKQDRAYFWDRSWRYMILFAILIFSISPFAFFDCFEYAFTASDTLIVPENLLSNALIRFSFAIQLASIFSFSGFIFLFIFFYYQIPDNQNIALALERIDKIKRNKKFRLTENEHKEIIYPYKIIRDLFSHKMAYGKLKCNYLKIFKKLFRDHIIRIIIYCKPQSYFSIREDILKAINSLKQKRYADFHEINESLDNKISHNGEYKKIKKIGYFNKILSHFGKLSKHITIDNIEKITSIIKSIWLISFFTYSLFIIYILMTDMDLLYNLLSNPYYVSLISVFPSTLIIYIVIKVYVGRKTEK